jgi:hypothetical protein
MQALDYNGPSKMALEDRPKPTAQAPPMPWSESPGLPSS